MIPTVRPPARRLLPLVALAAGALTPACERVTFEKDWVLIELREGSDVTDFPRDELSGDYTTEEWWLLIGNLTYDDQLIQYFEYVSGSGDECVEGWESYPLSTVAWAPAEGNAGEDAEEPVYTVTFADTFPTMDCAVSRSTLECLNADGTFEMVFVSSFYEENAERPRGGVHCDSTE